MGALAAIPPSPARRLLARRLLASASMAASAVLVGLEARWDRAILVFAALLAAGAVGVGRRGVMSQVFGRGVAWLTLLPIAAGMAATVLRGGVPDGRAMALGAATSAALLLARPALHTPEAKAAFAPDRYRRIFLAGAVAAVVVGAVFALFAVVPIVDGDMSRPPMVAVSAMALANLAAAVGVVRMRAWGVLLAMLASAASLGVGLVSGNAWEAFGLALAAIPGAVLGAPLLAARLGDRRERRSAPAVGARLPSDHEVRVRVAAYDAEADEAPAGERLDGSGAGSKARSHAAAAEGPLAPAHAVAEE
ncbi:MAG TPA: hypothetical protein VGG39_07830 [Polyangiaceae bacterium]|jgi:hypothetical protein